VGSSAHATLHRNPFVETTLTYVLSYITSVLGTFTVSPSAITILADDSYYTSPKTAQVQSFYGERFKYFDVPLWDAHKTGLGSSAALVTALTAALLAHYLPEDSGAALDETTRLRRLHNLAQAAHCAAQGKVGSGFDVASAVYGPSVYRRFSPSILTSLGNAGSAEFAKRLQEVVDGDSWDTEVEKDGIAIPSGLRLVMCDVDCGSQTPGMVKGVQEWRKKEPEEANMLWKNLHDSNQALAVELRRLTSESTKEDDKYDALKQRLQDIRELIRTMSRLSNVPIEPSSQTALIDFLSAVPGIIGGIVPGAGGFDAVALLITDTPGTIERLNAALVDWNKNATEAAAHVVQATGEDKLGKVGTVSLLAVREDKEGIKVEETPKYANWIVRREESSDGYVEGQ
jgi:phosphomevalonate kinase